MSVTVTIRDETTGGDVYNQAPLELPHERMTVREILRERIYQEVQDFNRRTDTSVFRGLVQPTAAESISNKDRRKGKLPRRPIDWKVQFDKAVESFHRNGFFVLVDNRQVAGLDDEFEVNSRTQITFVKLTPLVGG
jgi:hypothetical protein